MVARRAFRVGGRLVLATVVPLVVVESLLQVASLFTPREAESSAAPATEPCLALCVGDSFTYGLGASDPRGSYPSQLEAMVRDAPIGGRWRVANGGVSSRNSRDVLLDLPRRFRREQPRFVVVLVGVNDLWSRPDPVKTDDVARNDDAPPAWRFEWRTRKLLLILLRGMRTSEGFAGMGAPVAASKDADAGVKRSKVARTTPPDEEDAQYSWQLVGRWENGGASIVFERSGRVRHGASTLRWSVARAGEIRFEPADGAITNARARLVRGRLRLSVSGAAAPLDLERRGPAGASAVEPPPDWWKEFDRRLRSKDAAGAFAWSERWLAAEPDDPSAHFGHMRAAEALGRRDLFDSDLAALERIDREVGTCDAAESFLSGLDLANRRSEVGRLVGDRVDRFPDSEALRYQLAKRAELAGDLEGALSEMERSIALARDGTGEWIAYRYRESSRLANQLGRAAESAACLIRAVRACPDLDLDRQAILRDWYDDRVLAEAYALTDATPEERAYVSQRLAERRVVTSGAPLTVLADHLRQVARWCRDHGAQAVICSYPFRSGVVENAQRAAAAAEGVRFVDLASRFDDLLRTHAREEWFVADGHCNDAGYRIMAEEIATALRRLSAAPDTAGSK